MDEEKAVSTFACSTFSRVPLSAFPGVGRSRIFSSQYSQRAHRFLEVVLSEHALLIDDQVDSFASSWEKVVLQRSRTEVGIHNVTWLSVRCADPFGELHGVWYRSGEEDISNFVRQKDDGLFPDDSTFCWSEEKLC